MSDEDFAVLMDAIREWGEELAAKHATEQAAAQQDGSQAA